MRRGYILNLVIVTYGLLYSLSIPFVVVSVNNRVNLGPVTVIRAIVALFALYFSTIFLSLKGRVTLAGYLLIGVLLFSSISTFLTITLTPGSLTGAHIGGYGHSSYPGNPGGRAENWPDNGGDLRRGSFFTHYFQRKFQTISSFGTSYRRERPAYPLRLFDRE